MRNDVSGSAPASFRYNNPGAQYPSTEAARFGQTGYGIIGGGHKIARFPSPVNGAASNLDLLNRKYTGMTIGAAGTKWTGAYGFGVPGYDPNSMLTKAMLDDVSQAIPLLKAIAGRESGRGNNLTEKQWRQAHAMFKLGSADKYVDSRPPDTPITPPPPGTKTGAGLLKRAQPHIGEEYRNVLVPKNNSGWKGPWDCAEFMSWLVFQEAQILFGCLDDDADPKIADAYTGAWQRDVAKKGKAVSVDEAAATVGGIVLRFPPGPGEMGHIALCDGKGGTVEAKGQRYGVVADTVHGRTWHTGVLIPGITYVAPGTTPPKVDQPDIVYEPGAPNMEKEIIFKIQLALAVKGFDPGEIDGDYGPNTQAASSVPQVSRSMGRWGRKRPRPWGFHSWPRRKARSSPETGVTGWARIPCYRSSSACWAPREGRRPTDPPGPARTSTIFSCCCPCCRRRRPGRRSRSRSSCLSYWPASRSGRWRPHPCRARCRRMSVRCCRCCSSSWALGDDAGKAPDETGRTAGDGPRRRGDRMSEAPGKAGAISRCKVRSR